MQQTIDNPPTTASPVPSLTDEEVERFHRDGYLLLKGVISRTDAERCRRHVVGMMNADLTLPMPWMSRFGRIKPLQTDFSETFADPELIPLFQNERLYGAARQLLESDRLRVFDGSLAITIRHDVGGPYSQPLHLDVRVPTEVSQFRLDIREMELAGCFYLTDVKPTGGGICVVPGGHRLVMEAARAHPTGRLLHDFWRDIQGFPDPVEIVAEAGDFILTHFLMPHTASHNRLPNARVAQFLRWVRDDHVYGIADEVPDDRYDAAQRGAMSPLGRRLFGVDPWGPDAR
ncbi:phytanoyl-CoA dioxygenase family protein [Streptomyces sp. NPDC057539]|uniref:phytanoyl-CoA dioxygenase family protein n=1 Tax=Streptomyces sp. NPDC057539 TaxID=3346159 RepID=UPI0036C5B461